MILEIAETLGKFESEVLDGMTVDELSRWIALSHLRHEEDHLTKGKRK